MLIPLKHDNMTARRWPVITIGLIVLNTLIFIGTQATMEKESPELGEVKAHILILAARHPDLRMSAEEQKLVDNFRKQNERDFKMAQSFNAPVVDGWDARMRLVDNPDTIQAEMDSLGQRYSELMTSSFEENYAFVPAHPKPISYVTANFLHGGWLHLIGNMWFLWLAGFVLEDAWGRPLYAVFYLVAGAVGLQIHAMANPGSIIPCVGASGAVAALMGAFLVRFPKMKIHMAWLFGFRLYRFKAEAYWLLPLWLFMEVFYGTLFGSTSGTAHWAHVGGFVFGACGALGLRYSGLEKKMSDDLDVKLNPEGAQEVDQANEALQHGQLDVAITLATGVLAGKPDSIDALLVLREVYWRKSQIHEYQEIAAKLVALYIKKQATEAALETYDQFISTGGDKLPAATWLTLSRGLEDAQMFERALLEYGKLASAYPTATQSIMAQLGAARICLKKLGRPQEAIKYLKAADASVVPHLDMDHSIQAMIKEANAATPGIPQPEMA
jgi:membrane associated rhomboid family serine protease